MKAGIKSKKGRKRFNIPVIGHFANRSVRFESILQAEEFTGISYTLIFEACVGKVYKARNVYWEFENGAHYIKYKAHYIRANRNLQELGEHPGHGKRPKVPKQAAPALVAAV
jgi:hypothetical protein